MIKKALNIKAKGHRKDDGKKLSEEQEECMIRLLIDKKPVLKYHQSILLQIVLMNQILIFISAGEKNNIKYSLVGSS